MAPLSPTTNRHHQSSLPCCQPSPLMCRSSGCDARAPRQTNKSARRREIAAITRFSDLVVANGNCTKSLSGMVVTVIGVILT
ncbi:hypothetical protein E2562_014196 [Oryza meyeriana var. granulata]|uniref:Uncharacterized protein n=1 Tax=Oryza meyeriana var. granulata TaxID=110450 RepID=A0A6G1BKU6_9ORYZ|nr:hypothetical protein E2562_014196 [Oryza meyeriana var. granulata]